MQMDLRVTELLASKLCHDLISPVSAINNGVELIEDIGESVVDEAMKLIADSAGHASRRLKLFRVAYGRAGSEENLPVKDMRLIAAQSFSVGKIKLHWPETLTLMTIADKRGGLKTLINSLILSEELLAYGGDITVTEIEGDGEQGCRLAVVGRAAFMAENYKLALDGRVDVEDLTPRTIQAYVTGRFASYFGLEIYPCQVRDDCLEIAILVPQQKEDEPANEDEGVSPG